MAGLELNLPEMTLARTANVRQVDPLAWWDPIKSWFQSNFGSTIDKGLQTALQNLIDFGVPIAAQAMIGSMSYKLGNSQVPVDTTFAKSSGWAVALIIVLTLVCVAMVVLVGLCIWWERRVEERERAALGKARDANWIGVAEDDEVAAVEAASGVRHSRGSRSASDHYDEESSSAASSASGSHSSSSSSESSDSDEELAWQTPDISGFEDAEQEANRRHELNQEREAF